MNHKTLAAIDIGTNSFHLIVAEINKNSNFKIIDREKEVIRLSEGSKYDIKNILPAACDRAVVALKRFAGIALSHNAEIRAVATSAVREAFNRNEFVNRVFEETGVEIEIIDGLEEARLIYLGALKAVPIFDQKSLCIDIGGGSTEIILGYRRNVLFSNSLKLGAVRLTQKFFPDYIITKERINECKKWVTGEISQAVEHIKNAGFDICVGTSGTIMSAGLIVLANQKKKIPVTGILNNHIITYDELNEVYHFTNENETFDERKKIKGLDSERADIFPAGMIILMTILKALNIKQILVSGYSLREGIIIDTLQKRESNESYSASSNIRLESINHLAELSNFDQNHCRHVANLAMQIFDQTIHLHRLNNQHREYLEAAALLHDIGYHIGHARHHVHSSYIIKNSELLGFNEKEKLIIANIARYHRKSHPKPSHEDYMLLSEPSRDIVNKLASILRIADSLDRRHLKNIKTISVSVSSDEIILQINYSGEPPEIEIWNLERRQNLMQEVFGKKIVIKTNQLEVPTGG